ncbi:hypothetical protein BJ508DRAFT_197516, partial [Ascobolus immersus RN42]
EDMFWLTGMAGTGKSTVALTMASRFQDEGRLAASAFFSSDRNGGSSDTSKIWATICDSLVRQIPELAQEVHSAMDASDSRIFHMPQIDQCQGLVIAPIEILNRRQSFETRASVEGPYILVVDGFDACGGNDER